MSALFHVVIKEINFEKCIVKFHLTIINPDQHSFYNTKSFAVMLLLDPLQQPNPKHTSLLNEISTEDIANFNLKMFKKKESKIIKKVDITDIINFPLPPEITSFSDDEIRNFWSDKTRLPQALLTVTVKDPGYLSHLSKNQEWESGAFNII